MTNLNTYPVAMSIRMKAAGFDFSVIMASNPPSHQVMSTTATVSINWLASVDPLFRSQRCRPLCEFLPEVEHPDISELRHEVGGHGGDGRAEGEGPDLVEHRHSTGLVGCKHAGGSVDCLGARQDAADPEDEQDPGVEQQPDPDPRRWHAPGRRVR